MKRHSKLPVSGLACKELRSCHSILTTKKKAEKTEKSTTLLRALKEVRSQDKPLHTTLERQRGDYRESQLTGAGAHEKKPLRKLCQENLQ